MGTLQSDFEKYLTLVTGVTPSTSEENVMQRTVIFDSLVNRIGDFVPTNGEVAKLRSELNKLHEKIQKMGKEYQSH
jgi:hypothetical protein